MIRAVFLQGGTVMTRFVKQFFVITLASLLCLPLASCGRENGGTAKVVGESSWEETGAGESTGVEAGPTVLLVIAQEDFQDVEFNTVRHALKSAGYTVSVAAEERVPAVGVSGTRVVPDFSLSEAHAKGHAAVIFIGGPGTPSLFDSGEAHRLAREAAQGEGLLAAICLAPAILARAGVLKGKQATAYPTAAEDLEVGGAHYTGAAVEVDGNIVTAQGPEASEQFAGIILERLRHTTSRNGGD